VQNKLVLNKTYKHCTSLLSNPGYCWCCHCNHSRCFGGLLAHPLLACRLLCL